MRVIVSSERSWPLSPAARGEVCEASSALSSSATDSPALARWKAVAAPSAPGADHDRIGPFGNRVLVHVLPPCSRPRAKWRSSRRTPCIIGQAMTRYIAPASR